MFRLNAQDDREIPRARALGARCGVPPRKSIERGSVRIPWLLAGAFVFAVTLAATAYFVTQTEKPHGSGHRGAAERGAEIHALSGAPPTIAILPFEVLSQNTGQAYLAHGLTADLTADLSQLSGLTVIGTWSTGTAVPDARPPLSAARYRVWGGVRRDADRIHLHVVLIEAATGEQIWSERYDRPFSELLSIQEQISSSLAKVLSVEPTAAERRRIARRPTKHIAAYDLFLRAQANLLLRSESENRHARALYRKAIDLDPDFARALGGLALTYAADYRNRWTRDLDDALTLAKKTAESAVQMDPELPEVLWVLAYVCVQEQDHDRALGYLDKAIALDPSFADAYALKGSLKTHVGAPEEAVALLRHAMRLNPTSGYLYFLVLGRAYFFLGDTDRALTNLSEAIARNPTALQPHIYMAAAAHRAGDREAAEWEVLEILSLSPDFSVDAWLGTYPMTDAAQKAILSASLVGLGFVD